ncbi:MAG: EAL domain-containing protein [Solirubrobacterales bacterium]|nr:EAL domain-containing protein [Solirubrobacterales bacterium]
MAGTRTTRPRSDQLLIDGDTWTTQQLAEFVGALAGHDDTDGTVSAALEWAARSTEAEAGAILDAGGGTVAAIGFDGESPRVALRAVATGEARSLHVPGVGTCHAISVPIEDDGLEHLILARSGAPFSGEEPNLLRGVARVLALTLRTIRTMSSERELRLESERRGAENEVLLESLRERQLLFERLSRIQSSIVARLAIDDVLEAIVEGASELLSDETVGLRLIDRDDPDRMVLVATHGIPLEMLERVRFGRVGEGAGGQAILREELVVFERYDRHQSAIGPFAQFGVKSAMATPVREGGRVVGSLTVAREKEGHEYTEAERDILVAFAKHASIALTDARTVQDAIDQALQDPLTNLPNRALLADRLDTALARAERHGHEAAILFCDLDEFKNVNDSLGHAAGDELLVAVGRRLAGCVPPQDTAARFGGDEFAVLVEDTSRTDVGALADCILRALEEPFAVRGMEVFLSGSIGVAVGSSRTEDLLRNADLAMYDAKRRGSGRETFRPEMHASVVERLALEAELKRAILARQLDVHYQPIVDLQSMRIVAAEALVRWDHPARGPLEPGEFIPLAEQTGAIIALGRFVLDHAGRTAARWQSEVPGADAVGVSVNVSLIQLEQGGIADAVRDVLTSSGLSRGTLTLELTETAFGSDARKMAELLQELSDLDVELAVDDFGTGFSSLQHLQLFPIDQLKIPKPFVDGLGTPGDDSALAKAIIDIGESLGLRVVAEGIEHPEQIERLQELGCRYGQGFLLGRPMDAEAIVRTVGEDR